MRRNIIDVLGGNINNLAVIEACKKQDYQRLSFLLSFRVERQLSPNYHDKEGKTALIYSCAKGDVRSAKLLLAHGANIHLKDEEGKSALFYACINGHTNILLLLLSQPIEINSKDKDGRIGKTPLIYAVINGDVNLVKLLLNYDDTCIDFQDEDGKTALTHACERGNIDISSLLLSKNADLLHQDFNGRTPLIYTVINGDVNLVKLLLNNDDTNIDIQDDQGKTALIHASAKGDVRSAKLLLAHGANIHLKDEEGVIGRSACSYAFNSGNNEIIELFLDKILTKYVNRKSTDSIIDISSSRDSSISSDIYIAR
jgi:ankyrin repeat protein